jgi:hypothetical protein
MRTSVRNGDRDATGELGALIALARAQGFYVRAAAGGVVEVEDRRTDDVVYRGTAAEAHRWLRDVAQKPRP